MEYKKCQQREYWIFVVLKLIKDIGEMVNIENLGGQEPSGVREGGDAEPFDRIEQYRRYCKETYQDTVEMPTLEIFDKKVH